MVQRCAESYEALEYTLDRQDRLRNAKDPKEIILAVADAIEVLDSDHDDDAGPDSIQSIGSDIQDILEQVRAAYETVIIPRHYNNWWEDAQKELTQKIDFHTAALEQLRTAPCSTPRERKRVREFDYRASLGSEYHDEYKRTISDPQAFAQWKQEMEKFLEHIIRKYHGIERRLRENQPSQDA